MQRTSRSMGCCGVTEIYDLDTGGWDREQTDTIPFVLSGHRAGIAIATTISTQKESIRHLKAHGFHAVLETPNPKTDTCVTLWVRDLSEGKLPVLMGRKTWKIFRAWHFFGYIRRLMRSWNATGNGLYVDNKVLRDEE